MNFKTKRTSKTGLKFSKIEKKIKICFEEEKKLLDEIGVKQYRKGYWTAFGGISSLVFDKDMKIPGYMKKIRHEEYMPKKNIKEGIALDKKIKELPVVSKGELNACIGFKENMLKTIGFESSNPEYFLFSVNEDWGIKIPKDCKEITTTEYNKLANACKEVSQ